MTTAQSPQLVAGYDTEFTVYLTKADGTADNVSTASSIVIAFAAPGRGAVVAGPYVADSGHGGADWSAGKVVISVPGTDTIGKAGVEVYADAKAVIGAAVQAYFGTGIIELIKSVIP